MRTGLQILLVCDVPEEATSLADEITSLFDGCRITATAWSEPIGDMLSDEYDVLLVCLSGDDSNQLRMVEQLQTQTTGKPNIVVLPSSADHLLTGLRPVAGVYPVRRQAGYRQEVTTVIEEILRLPTPITVEEQTIAEGNQAAMIRTAAGTLAHEINNPLMTILGISELILDEKSGYHPDVARKITMIRRSAERIESSLKRLANIDEPVLRETPSGVIVDREDSAGRPASAKSRS